MSLAGQMHGHHSTEAGLDKIMLKRKSRFIDSYTLMSLTLPTLLCPAQDHGQGARETVGTPENPTEVLSTPL
eukprot:scaffold5329_cov85-Skeletonema_menzelii.AAC.7